jgi:hypothetical protein
VFTGVTQSISVTGVHGENLSKLGHFMPLASQYLRYLHGHIVIEKESHTSSGPLIWRAIKVSISAR